MDDNKIIELYNQRLESAIAKTKEKYNQYIYAIINNILHNEEDNEECLNDTYLRLWNSIPPAEPVCLKAYTGKIARNLALNRLRDLERNRKINDRAFMIMEEMHSISSLEDTIDKINITEIINAFLKELSEEKRIMFIRRYWYFDSINEISDKMNVSESKVKMTLKRLREKLNKKICEEGAR